MASVYKQSLEKTYDLLIKELKSLENVKRRLRVSFLKAANIQRVSDDLQRSYNTMERYMKARGICEDRELLALLEKPQDIVVERIQTLFPTTVFEVIQRSVDLHNAIAAYEKHGAGKNDPEALSFFEKYNQVASPTNPNSEAGPHHGPEEETEQENGGKEKEEGGRRRG